MFVVGPRYALLVNSIVRSLGRYMIANINTINTATTVPTGLLQRKEATLHQRLSRWCCAQEKASRLRRNRDRDLMARAVSAWVDLTALGRLASSSRRLPRSAKSTFKAIGLSRSATAPGGERLPGAGLHFFNCYEIVLPNAMTSLRLEGDEAKSLSARVESSLTQWARAGLKRFRDRARLRHEYRSQLRRAEFDAWFV